MTDYSADGLGTRLRRLLELLDGDVQATYAGAGLDYRPRFTPVMKALADGRELTIKEIALQSSVSHSAASQTVMLMIKAGLLDQTIGQDARERRLALSERAEAMLPVLETYWQATFEAAIELERDIGFALSQATLKAIEALETRPFRLRINAANDRQSAKARTKTRAV